MGGKNAPSENGKKTETEKIRKNRKKCLTFFALKLILVERVEEKTETRKGMGS